MSKRPSFQFYPADWRKDTELRLCSIAARGLWADMLCLMHESTPYGHLAVMGRPMAPDSLARLVGEGAALVRKLLAELRDNAVFSETQEGVIFSRRMIRDEKVRDARASGGQAGAEHGIKGGSHGAKGGRPKSEKPPLAAEARGVSEPPLKPPPSSSSSSPSSEEGSDADASGGEAPPMPQIDPVKVMFDAGVRLLADAGIADGKARSLIGKWRQAHGPPAVITALGKAQREGAIDPVAFIEGCFKNGNRNGHQLLDPDGIGPNARAALDVFGAPGRAMG